MDSINYEPIGIIRTQYTVTLGMPIQAALAQKSVLAVAEISEQFVEGLTDLTAFSHIILIYHFHKSREAPMMQKPFLDDQKHGVFSIRSPRRPNPIGMSVVELIRIEENRLYFNGADMLDETPLLDIKPFVHRFDNRENASLGWLSAVDQG
jgi:tRNA (adenine37-N6)-methyltransferase